MNKRRLFLTLLPTMFLLCGCDHHRVVDSNGNQNGNGDEPGEITWQQTALDTSAIYALAADSNGRVYAATQEGIARTADRGSTWTTLEDLRAFVIALSVSPAGDIFAAASGGFTPGFLFRSTDSGETWTKLDVDNSISPGAPVFSSSGQIFVGSGVSDESRGGIFHSIDNGDTWQQTSYPDTLSAAPLTINDNGDLFAGSELGLMRSTDNGVTWTLIEKPEFEKFKIRSFAVNPKTGDIFAAVIGDGVFRSTDNGNTWTLTNMRNSNPYIFFVLVINSKGEIFAGSFLESSGNSIYEPVGIFYSNDNGDTWRQINNGLTNLDILSLTVDTSGFVYASTDGDGVFRTMQSTIKE